MTTGRDDYQVMLISFTLVHVFLGIYVKEINEKKKMICKEMFIATLSVTEKNKILKCPTFWE